MASVRRLSEHLRFEDEANYRGRSCCACLGFWVVAPGVSEPVLLVGLSECLSKRSEAAIDGSRMVEKLLASDSKTEGAWETAQELHYWADCGNHFRSYEFLHHALAETVRESPFQLRFMHYAVEKHGKDQVDSPGEHLRWGGVGGSLGQWVLNFA